MRLMSIPTSIANSPGTRPFRLSNCRFTQLAGGLPIGIVVSSYFPHDNMPDHI